MKYRTGPIIMFLTLVSQVMLITMSGCNYETKEAVAEHSESKDQSNMEQELDLQSKETMKIAMQFMEAMGKGDMEAMSNLMHDDMVWDNSGDKSLPWIGPWSGKQVILEQFFPTFGVNFQTKKWEPTDGFANGNTAAFFGQMIGLLTNSGKETEEFTYALRVKVKDGKVILWNWFEDSYAVSQAYHN